MPSVVLIVDYPMILDLTASMLEELGCRASTCPSASDALRVLQEQPEVTTLLTDVQMPGTSGVELAAQARRIRSHLDIVFASGRESVAGWPFLRKPFSREELWRLVHC